MTYAPAADQDRRPSHRPAQAVRRGIGHHRRPRRGHRRLRYPRVHRGDGPLGIRASRRSCTAWRRSTPPRPAMSSSATSSWPGSTTRRSPTLRRDKIGFVFQAYNLVPTLTARENILLPLSIAGRKPDQAVVRHRDQDSGPRVAAQAPAQRALRWPAAAGRLRPSAGLEAGHRLRGRAHRQPGLGVRRRGARLPAQERRRVTTRPSSWSPTTRSRRRTRTGSSSWTTAGSSTSCDRPTSERVFEKMKQLSARTPVAAGVEA